MCGPHVGASLAASGTGKARFDIRQPEVIGPAVGADPDAMAAFVVAAIDDQHIVHAGSAQFAECDFLRVGRHGRLPITRPLAS
jgi:hypothetical protein